MTATATGLLHKLFSGTFMPRISDKRGQQKHALSVSPWMTKKGLKEGAAEAQAPGQQQPGQNISTLMYSVVLSNAPLTVASSGHASQQEQHAQQPAAPAAAPAAVVNGQHHAAPTMDTGSGWHQVRRPPKPRTGMQFTAAAAVTSSSAGTAAGQAVQVVPLAQQRQQQQQQPATAAALCGIKLLDAMMLPAQQQQQQQQQADQQRKVLHGISQLVLHPSGSISGHFTAAAAGNSNSNAHQPQQQQQQQRLCLGLQGRQVLGLHSCYRDPEWALLQMSVIRYRAVQPTPRAGKHSSNSSGRHGSRDDKDKDVGDSVYDGSSEQQQQQLEQEEQQHAAKRVRVTPEQQQQQQVLVQNSAGTSAAVAAAGTDGGSSAAAAPAAAAAAADGDGDDIIAQFNAATAAAATSGDLLPVSISSSGGATPAPECASEDSAPDPEPGQLEAVAWVQRTGGDLVTLLPADMDDEDTEAAVLQDSLGLDPDFVVVNFTPHTLLAGAAAERQLARLWPEMLGQGSVVNLGEMSIANLPQGFLQD